MAKQYIRHLDKDGNLVFSNVKTVGELSDLRTENKSDVISAINEIVKTLSIDNGLEEVRKGLQDIVSKYSTMSAEYEELNIEMNGEKTRLTEISNSFNEKLSGAQSSLQGALETSRTQLMSEISNVKDQVLSNYKEVDGKLQNVEKEIVNTNDVLSSKLSKAEFEENIGLNKWTVSKYNTDKTYDIDYPTIAHLEGKSPVEVIGVTDSVSLFPYSSVQTTLLHYFTNIKQIGAKTIQFSVTHNDGFAVLLNGAYVSYKVGSGTSDVSISLRAGWNTVEILIGVKGKVGKLNLSSKISDNVDKLTSVIGVGDKNESRLYRAETNIIQTNESIKLKADSKTVTQMGNNIASQQAELSVMSDEIASKVSQSDFNNYTGRIEEAETKITQTATAIESLAKKSELDTLNGKVGEAQTKISQTAEAITQLATKEDVDTVKGTVTSVQGQITTQAGQIGLMATKESLNKETGDIKSQMSTMKVEVDKISTKVDTTKFNELTGKVETQATAITQLDNEIGLKASKSELDTATGRIGTVESQLNVQAGQISTKVGQTEVTQTITSAINNISIGGRNLFRNSSTFRIGTAGNGVTPSITTEGYLQVIAVEGAVNAHSGWHSVNATDGVEGQLNEGDDITISFEMKSPNHTKIPQVYIKSGMGYFKLEGTMSTNFSKFSYTTKWKKANTISLHFGWSGIVGTTIIKNMQLEKGNKATDWQPSQEDVQSDILSKANASTVTAIEKRVESTESAIVQTNKDIKLKVNSTDVYTKTQVDNSIGNIQNTIDNRDGSNLIPIRTGWEIGSATLILNQVQAKSVIPTRLRYYDNPVPIVGDAKYTYSNSNMNYCLAIHELDENLKLIKDSYWLTEKTKTFNTLANTKYVRFLVRHFSDQGQLIDVKDVLKTKFKLEKGDKATSWSHSPLDIDVIEERVSVSESEIRQTKEAIALKVSSKEVYTRTETEKIINDIKIGGANLLSKGNLHYSIVKDSEDTNGLQVATWAGIAVGHSQVKKILQPSTIYTITYKFRLDSLTANSTAFTQNSHGTLLLYSGTTGSPNVLLHNSTISTVNEANTWKVGDVVTRQATFTTPANLHETASNYRIIAYTRRSMVGEVAILEKGTFFDIMLEEGNKPTAYTPSIYDIEQTSGRNLLVGTADFSTGYNDIGDTQEGIELIGSENSILGYTVPTEGVATPYVDMYRNKTTIIPKGKTYTLSFWARATKTTTILNYFHFNNISTITGEYNGNVYTSIVGEVPIVIDSVWRKYVIKYTQNPNEVTAPKQVIIGRLNPTYWKANDSVYISAPKLEEGINRSTEWTPAPEDAQVILKDLVTRVSDAEIKIDKDKIVSTVMESTSFSQALDEKADGKDLADKASTDYVDGAKDEAKKYADEKVNEKDEEVEKKFTKIIQDVNSFNFKIEQAGGINMVKNSIGFSEFNNWTPSTYNGTISIFENSNAQELDLFKGFYFKDSTTGASMYQEINISPSKKYALSFYVKRESVGVDGDIYVRILYKDSTGTEKFIHHELVPSGKADEVGKFIKCEAVFETSENIGEVNHLRMGGLKNTPFYITGLMLSEGELHYKWSLAEGEIFNANVVLDQTGVKVSNSTGKSYTHISTEEFAGYSEVEGNMKKVFTINDDVTEVTKIDVDEEISMNPIKILSIKGARNGWAFVKST